jgi:hypothetical protein
LSNGCPTVIYRFGIDPASIQNFDLNVPDRHSSFIDEKRDTKSILRFILARVPDVATSHDVCTSEMETHLSMIVRYWHFPEVQAWTVKVCLLVKSGRARMSA